VRLRALVVLVAAATLFGCHDTPDRSRVLSFAPRVSCCDFRDRDVCHDESALSLARPAYVLEKGICYKHGECFYNCPPGEGR